MKVQGYLGAALMFASAQAANADDLDHLWSETTYEATNSFRECAAYAMKKVLGAEIADDDVYIEGASKLYLHVAAFNIDVKDMDGMVSMSVEWNIDPANEDVRYFDKKGYLKATFSVVGEPAEHSRFAAEQETVTTAIASTRGNRVDVRLDGNANSNSLIRTDVSRGAEELMKNILGCPVITPFG